MVDIHQDAKHPGISLELSIDLEGDSSFSIYQNIRIKIIFITEESIQCKPFFYFIKGGTCHLISVLRVSEPKWS